MVFVSYIIEVLKRGIISFYGAYAGGQSFLPRIDSLPSIVADTIKFYANTPNTIIRFETKTSIGYFRECRNHLNPKEYLRELFNDYCCYVYVTPHSQECRRILFSFLDSDLNWKRFYKMGEGTAKFSKITRFRKTGDYHLLGFPDGLPEWFYEQLLQLVQFAWGPVMEHRYCHNLKPGCYQTFNSSKSIVSKFIADYLGVGELIPRTYYAKLEFDGRERVGVVVESANGEDPGLFNRKLALKEISPYLQKNLVSLWIVDMVCYQKDHRPGNYFIGEDKNRRYCSVSAFDNDCPTTLFPTTSISFSTYVGIEPLFNPRGFSRIPYISESLYRGFEEKNFKDLKKDISVYCSKLESFMLYHRTVILKKNLYKSVLSGNLVLLSDTDWSLDTIRAELRIPEDTYFSYFVRHYADTKTGLD